MPKRAAVVIHGIGRQQPYQTARAFADGLISVASEKPSLEQIIPQMRPDQAAGTSGQALPQSHGQVPPGRVYRITSGNTMIDVYEAYWAPLTTGLTSFLGLLWWLSVNTFVPSRLLSVPTRKTVHDVSVAIFFLAIVTVVYYFLFGALLLTTHEVLLDLGSPPKPPLLAGPPSWDPRPGWANAVGSFWHLLKDSWRAPWTIELGKVGLGSISNVLSPVTLGWLLYTVVGIYCMFQFLYRITELVGDLRDRDERVKLLRWPPWPIPRWRLIVHLLIALAFGYVYVAVSSGVKPKFFAYGTIYVMFQLAYLAVRTTFVDYIGDIEVYVTRDSKSARFAAREEIRSRAVDVIKAALMSAEKYEDVVVLGHSLGSVIGLDAIREVRREAGRTDLTQADFRALKSFVTFGSPLEKTRFFFERLSPDDPRQWRGFLREIQQTFAQDADTGRISWTNFWYFPDVVANSLATYNSEEMPDLLESFELSSPWYAFFWAHNQYVVDKQFLGPILRRLLEGPPKALRHDAAGPAVQ